MNNYANFYSGSYTSLKAKLNEIHANADQERLEKCKNNKNFNTNEGLVNYIMFKAFKNLQSKPIKTIETSGNPIDFEPTKLSTLMGTSLFPLEYFNTLPFEVCFQILNLSRLKAKDLLAFSLTSKTAKDYINADGLKNAKLKIKVKSLAFHLYAASADSGQCANRIQYCKKINDKWTSSNIKDKMFVIEHKTLIKVYEDIALFLKQTKSNVTT